MTDREQVRQNAEQWPKGLAIRNALARLVAQDSWEKPNADAAGRALDNLLADLEQAERDNETLRSDFQTYRNKSRLQVQRLDARLAKVPALVEALRFYADLREINAVSRVLSDVGRTAREAITAWEQDA